MERIEEDQNKSYYLYSIYVSGPVQSTHNNSHGSSSFHLPLKQGIEFSQLLSREWSFFKPSLIIVHLKSVMMALYVFKALSARYRNVEYSQIK